MGSLDTSPQTVVGAITAAIQATLALLLFLDVDPELVGALQLAAIAWVGAAVAIVKNRTTTYADPKTNDGVPVELVPVPTPTQGE